MKAKEIRSSPDVVRSVLEQLLSTEIEGVSSSYKAVTIKTGPIVPSEGLREVRASAIRAITSQFRWAAGVPEKRRLVNLLARATVFPHRGAQSNDLTLTILNDTVRVLRFFNRILSGLNFQIVQEIEHDLLWLYRRNDAAEGESPDIAQARKRVVEQILKFRDMANAFAPYVAFKTLVGYQSVFRPAWNNRQFEVEGQEEYRAAEIERLAGKVTVRNADHWLAFLDGCAQADTTDLASWPSFDKFLIELAQRKPAIALGYLTRTGPALSSFIPSLLWGLDRHANYAARVGAILARWIRERRNLRQLIHYLKHSQTFNSGLLERSLTAAIAANDDVAVLSVLEAATRRHSEAPDGLIGTIFLPALRVLVARGVTSWPYRIWPAASKAKLIADLDAAATDEVLNALVPVHKLDYRVEELMAAIARRWPEKVVDHFMRRIDHDSSLPRDATYDYDDVPYQFHVIQREMSTVPDYLVKTVRKRFTRDDHLFTFREGRLLANAFPEFGEGLSAALIKLVSGQPSKDDLLFVVRILRNYHGEVVLHPVLKAVVAHVAVGDPLANEIEVALESTGVVRGEFGMVEAYQGKKAEIAPWLGDQNPNVAAFARRYTLALDRMINAERRRAEQELAMRRRDWPAEDEAA